MNFSGNTPNSITFPPSKQPQLNLRQAFNDFQTHCSNLFTHFSHHLTLLNPEPHLRSTLFSLQTHAKNALDANLSRLNSCAASKTRAWARVANNSQNPINFSRKGAALSTEVIEERLEGIPVYALSNSDEEFVLLSGTSNKKSLGLLCFNKEDAETLLEQMKSMDPGMRSGCSKVVPVALNKVVQLKVDGVAFRLIPESTQVKNALTVRENTGFPDDVFHGVPVFQSQNLILRSGNKSYRPVFFRKEDLEKSLEKASRQQHQLNLAFRKGDIQVAVFEEIVNGMKDSATSKWDDVVFVPPGYDASTDPSQLSKTA
ncbi:hypothetical protein SLA2020_230730 [Shorea laevis]